MINYLNKYHAPKTKFKVSTSSIEIRKLQVYTSKGISKTINFPHPYYLPEDDRIMQTDISWKIMTNQQ